MREPMVGSLIYGDHKVPRKTRPWQEMWKLPAAVGVVFIIISILVYQYCNYRQEGAVRDFLAEVYSGNTDAAFSRWDTEGTSYTKQDFLNDWGKDGYFTKNVKSARVIDSNGKGTSVIVYVEIDTFKLPQALLVDNQSLKLSSSPTNKYRARASHE